jgi:anti-sigma-K factor RskA
LDKEQLLSEGYLEAYLTEDLSHSDMQEVEQWITTDREVKIEYHRVQKTLELLAFHFGKAPSQTVKRTLMENAEVMKDLAPPTGKGWNMMMAASITLALLSAISAFYFWGKWQSANEEMTEMLAQNILMAENVTRTNQELDEVKNNLSVLISPEFSRIVLNGTANAPDAKAVIYWNAAEQEVFLNAYSLAELPEGKQYQLWALVDGQPIDAGVFDPMGDTFQKMKLIAKADAFAVTIEQTGGSATPALETLQVVGMVAKG